MFKKTQLIWSLGKSSANGSLVGSLVFDAILAALLVACVFAIRFALGIFGANIMIFAVCYPAILIATLVAGLRCGVIALVISTLVFWWAFVPPAYSFALLSATDAINLILYLVAGAAIIWVAHIYRAALQELQEQKSHNELLTRELNHRSKNSLAVISSIVNQSLKHDTESSQKIIGRLAAMRHGDELIQSGNQPAAPLEAVIRRELEFYDHSRLKMAGAEVQVSGAIARSVCMVIHELATNAVKYGAWSNTTGIVTIIWQTNGSTASIDWKETGGPPPAAKNRAGFGTFLIERLLSQYGGDVQLTWPLSGLVCTLTVPVRVQENEVRT